MGRKDVRDSEQQGTTTESAEAGKENRAPLHKPQDGCTQTHRTESMSIKKEQCEECVKLNEQIVSLKNHVKTLQSSDQAPNDQKNERMEKELTEKCAIQKAIGAKLQKELVEARSKNDELRKALHVLDEQCDKLMVIFIAHCEISLRNY
ncbi:unnamed protein product [Anisakis simplex]|uniref:Coiled-coil domain-containing protein 30 n=1 Tax=Anisakis simplex TaxID=6269 RepID=A0A0M3JEM5_ANISI|nr:unnamed protein product [Anisakis simplex]